MQLISGSLPKFPTSATLLVSKSALVVVAIPETVCMDACPVLDSKLARLANGFGAGVIISSIPGIFVGGVIVGVLAAVPPPPPPPPHASRRVIGRAIAIVRIVFMGFLLV